MKLCGATPRGRPAEQQHKPDAQRALQHAAYPTICEPATPPNKARRDQGRGQGVAPRTPMECSICERQGCGKVWEIGGNLEMCVATRIFVSLLLHIHFIHFSYWGKT